MRLDLAAKKIFYCIVVFMYVFMFKIVGVIDSAIAVGCVVAFLVLFDRKAQRKLRAIFRSKKFGYLLIAFAAVCVWIFIATTLNGTRDYSFVKTWIHILLQIAIGILVYCYLYGKGQARNIVNYIIVAFLIQSVIEWLGLLSPTVKSLIYMTKSASTIRIANQYGGIRGLSLAGSSFFGLAVAFGLVYILFFSSYNTLFGKHRIIKLFSFFLLLSGTFFAGRTGVVGLLLAAIYGVARFVAGKTKINGMYAAEIAVIVALGFAVFFIIAHYFKNANAVFKKISYLYNYVFEAFISLFRGKGLSTTSTAELFNEMYFDIPFKTLLIGDGYYTDPVTGAYYMNTDSGYMRVILYLGLPGLALLFWFQYCLFCLGDMEKRTRILCWIFMIILQIKGEAIGFSMILQSVILLSVLQRALCYDEYAEASRHSTVKRSRKARLIPV